MYGAPLLHFSKSGRRGHLTRPVPETAESWMPLHLQLTYGSRATSRYAPPYNAER